MHKSLKFEFEVLVEDDEERYSMLDYLVEVIRTMSNGFESFIELDTADVTVIDHVTYWDLVGKHNA